MPPAPRKTRIKVGVIGLGIIGSRVAANLRGAGHQVYVWSRSPHRVPNFLGSVVEVADLSNVIQVFVSDDDALLDVTRTIAAALSPRHLFASHATVSPGAARQAASIIESQGARYLDAPFTGSKTAAQNRQLVYYVGSTKEALQEIRPVLEASSRQILHVGGIGDASVLKIATNLLTASAVQTLAEALALVRAAGVADQKLFEALEFNASRSATTDLKLPAMIAQNFEPNFSLKHMLKDTRLALNMADSLELSLPVSETTAEVMSLGISNGWGEQDYSVISQLYPFTGSADAPDPLPVQPEPDAAMATAPSAQLAEASPTQETVAVTTDLSPQPAVPTLGNIKERTLGALRGFFKSPAPKPKRSPPSSPAEPAASAVEPAATAPPPEETSLVHEPVSAPEEEPVPADTLVSEAAPESSPTENAAPLLTPDR